MAPRRLHRSLFFVIFFQVYCSAENPRDLYNDDVQAIYQRLNASPFEVYNYKDYIVLYAHKKADITELTIDVNVDCNNKYPDVPCTRGVLTCQAFIRTRPGGAKEILNDVNCKPRPEIIIEEVPPSAKPTDAQGTVTDPKMVVLSNEAVSSEAGDHFVAVRRDQAQCLGCAFDLNPNVSGVADLTRTALHHIESERDHKYNLVKVLRLQQQVVAGVKYILTLEVAQSTCLKTVKEQSCPINAETAPVTCEITYLEKPWVDNLKHIIKNNCTVAQGFQGDASPSTKTALKVPNFEYEVHNSPVKQIDGLRLKDLEAQILIDLGPHSRSINEISSEGTTKPVKVPATAEQQRTSDNLEVFNAIPNASEPNPIVSDLVDGEDNVRRKRAVKLESSTVAAVTELASTTVGQNIETNLRNGKKVVERVKDSSEESNESESKSSSEENTRPKRAVSHLEKISPEEKHLAMNLADFAANELDRIDDDNHKLVILQILGAKKMISVDGTYYRLIMRMGVSHCLEDEAFNERCRDTVFENYTKICKVQVFVNDELLSPKLVKSQCQNNKRDKDNNSNRTNYSRFKRLSRDESIQNTTEEIASIAQDVVDEFNEQNITRKFTLVKVKSTKLDESKSGRHYKLKLKVDDGDGEVECTFSISHKFRKHKKMFKVKCEDGGRYKFKKQMSVMSRRSILPGGEFNVGSTNAFVQKYIEDALRHLDAESGEKNKLKTQEIISATSQVVAGHIYRIKVKVILSDCEKTTSSARDLCSDLPGAPSKVCDLVVFNQLWVKDSQVTNITCEGGEAYSFRAKNEPESGLIHAFNERHRTKRETDAEEDSELFYAKLFHEFTAKYQKGYSESEAFYRFKVFRKNIKHIRMLNSLEQGSAWYGISAFTDRPRKEFSRSHGLRARLTHPNKYLIPAEIPRGPLPTEFDWRAKGAVSGVKNQEQCGSCWAFSVTGNIEGQYAIKHEQLLEFSEQELVDCDKEDQGCNGGLMDTAYKMIEELGGLETETDYPYDAKDETCHFNKTLARVQVVGALNISQNETEMAQWLVGNGPISIAINANAMQFYMGGVSHPYKFLCSPTSLDHGVLIVGFGVHSYPLFNKSLPYWIVKNSWGTSWGEQGYYRVFRGDGTCGVNQTPSSAIVS